MPLFGKDRSLRQSILAIILSIAMLSIIALLVSSNLYKHFVLEIEKKAASDVLQVKINDVHREIATYAIDLGLTLQSSAKLRENIKKQTYDNTVRLLNDSFHQYYVTGGIISLEKIYLLDKNYQFIRESTDSLGDEDLTTQICTSLIKDAEKRTGADRLKPIMGLCSYTKRGYLSVIVPVGTLNPFAYLQIIISPTHHSQKIATDLGIPIKVYHPDNTLAFSSTEWPQHEDQTDFIYIDHFITNKLGLPVYRIEVARNVELFQKAFSRTTYTVLFVSVLILIIGLVVATAISRRALNSLNAISLAAQSSSEGQFQQLLKSGYIELDHVIGSYNIMVDKVVNSQQGLEQEVSLATQKLSSALAMVEKRNQELEAAIMLSEQANATKSSFLANMSHELRTPLNAVIGYSELILDDLHVPQDSYIATDIQKIRSAGKHLLEIVNNILDLSKIEAGKLEFNPSQFDLHDLIKNVVYLLLPLARAANNTLHVHTHCDELVVHTDATRLKQIIFNIVSNAIKFTNQGEIWIDYYPDTYLDTQVFYIRIKDTGIGMKEDDLKRLFKPFEQVDTSSTRRYDGAGLGLALSKQICDGLGGNIQVESEYGVGSIFTIRMPMGIHK